jgi:hypothetical protein
VGAILKKDGLSVGDVVSVTPQRYYKNPGERGCRVDIEVVTDRNERSLIEVQADRDVSMLARNLFSAAHIFRKQVPEGTPTDLIAAAMPRVICIDILNFDVRSDSEDWFQPVKLLYAKPPHIVALPHFSVYCVQLPRFREAAQDFADPAYCWMYAWDRAYRENLTIREVVEMTPGLQTFVELDKGFLQYCERFGIVTADNDTRDEYFRWVNEQMRQAGMKAAAEQEGWDKGLRKGMRDANLQAAKKLLARGFTPQEAADVTELPIEDVLMLNTLVN